MLKIDLRQGKDLTRAACGRLPEALEDESVTVTHRSLTEFLKNVSRDAGPAAFPVLDDSSSRRMLAVLSLEYLNGCLHFDMTLDGRKGANQDFRSYIENRSYHSSERLRRDKICADIPLAEYAASILSFHLDRVAYAAQSGQFKIAGFMLANSSVPNASGKDSLVPLHWASLAPTPSLSEVKFLKGMKSAGRRKKTTKLGETSLGYAFAGGDSYILEAFMRSVPPHMIRGFFHEARYEKTIEAFLDMGSIELLSGCG
ncbi:hypothetical protein FSARC_14892 [Fusarium sarcochroum]|uniref:Uncharacterized protein n=1 Tax=Fusarium sarcochroum TaxID=1208366 RepID=A0A8H4SQ56_9HYPO|nr:hypothetical protein FSARC_14892 [Fusarium sarcochroum]